MDSTENPQQHQQQPEQRQLQHQPFTRELNLVPQQELPPPPSSSSSSNQNDDDNNIKNISSSPLSTDSHALAEICFTNETGNAPFQLDQAEDDFTDDEDDNDSSCASTVVNDLPVRVVRPPPDATPAEQARFYWELCYGTTPQPKNELIAKQLSWSASRRAPTRSCLSVKKTPWGEIAASASKRKERRVQMKVTPTQGEAVGGGGGGGSCRRGLGQGHTPMPKTDGMDLEDTSNMTMSLDVTRTPAHVTTPQHSWKCVQFGLPSAVEFETTRPTIELTPLPSEQARERFPLDQKRDSDDESEELHEETARNAAILAEWDDDFDSILDISETEEDDDEDNLDLLNGDLGEKRKSHRERQNGRRKSKSSTGRGRGDRRSSTFFSKGGKSLLQDDDRNAAKIAPQSPERGGDIEMDECNNNKDTPKMDMSSSSSLLRSVHSEGGAQDWRTRHDDVTQELMPNQLDLRLQKAEEVIDSKSNKKV